MKKTREKIPKILSSAVIILLLLSIAAAFNPLASAQSAPIVRTLPTQSYMRLSPNPAGVNQAVTIFVFCSLEPAQINNRPYFGWNYTVTVTDPSGRATTYNMPMTLSTGYTYIAYTPTEIGTYKVQAHLPAFYIYYDVPGTGGFSVGNYSFQESYTTIQTLTVQKDEVLPWPQTPLPTGYWQFPITAENQLWGSIAGNWLYRSTQNPPKPDQTWGPRTAHILWTKPVTIGGISGGSLWGETEGGLSYWTGLLYQRIVSPVIISGYLFYNMNPAGQGKPGVNCVNLRTGETVWSNSSFPTISCGQVFTRIGGLGSGSLAYLWTVSGSTWTMWDAWNGHFITEFVNATGSFSPYFGPSGEIIVYNLNAAGHWITKWNSSRAILGTSARPSESWSPFSPSSRAWSSGIQWNVTIPTVPSNPSWRMTDMEDDVIVAEGNFNATTSNNPVFTFVGYSASTGQQLWVKNYTNIGWGQGGPVNAGMMVFNWAFGEGVFAIFEREAMKWHIIDIKTGIERATTPPLNTITNNDWSFYDWHPAIRYGKLYTVGYSGSICCFDLNTGASEWVFNQINSGVQTPYGDWPTYGGMTIADGIVYWGVSQHTPATPMYRGYNLYAVNATTGKQIWSLPCFADPNAVAAAGSQLLTFNGYDNQIYAIGKGLSATTVTTAPALNGGKEILITGTVTDQSPGQTAIGVPAAGTPAIADAFMTQWMKYLYQQQLKPTDAKGVPVTLTAVDPNGNFQNIGTTTSDITGNYAISWTPPVPGIYTITATFAGTDSYYASSGETSMLISSTSVAPVVTSTPTQTTPPTSNPTPTPTQAPVSPSPSIAPQPTSGMPTTTYVAIGAAVIIVVAAAAALILRRRK